LELTAAAAGLIVPCRKVKMKILVIGGGGREHALIWKLKQSPAVDKIWCAPGNGGICDVAECFPADPKDIHDLVELAKKLRPDLTVIGPELPLVLGLADALRELNFAVVGPGKAGAELEGSKVFAKRFMEQNGIPTARLYGVYEDATAARAALDQVAWPMVIKADGLCAGKGVLVTSSRDEAEKFINRLMNEREMGDGGLRVMMEEALNGDELSYIVLTDGQRVIPFAPARDHKRAFDGDRGPNTGGMGAYSTDSILSPELEKQIQQNVVQPTIRGLTAAEIPYRGFLYFGLMLTPDGPKVLEYNCRMGDPETQAILLRADFDLASALLAVADGDLAAVAPKWKPGASVCVVLAAKGYPEKTEVGARISGLDGVTRNEKVVVFNAATRKEATNYYVSGGRVLSVCGAAQSIAEARDTVYDMISTITFDGMHFRSDIGSREVAFFQASSRSSRS
jgi:phosphoribosylamine--glycine ligase